MEITTSRMIYKCLLFLHRYMSICIEYIVTIHIFQEILTYMHIHRDRRTHNDITISLNFFVIWKGDAHHQIYSLSLNNMNPKRRAV